MQLIQNRCLHLTIMITPWWWSCSSIIVFLSLAHHVCFIAKVMLSVIQKANIKIIIIFKWFSNQNLNILKNKINNLCNLNNIKPRRRAYINVINVLCGKKRTCILAYGGDFELKHWAYLVRLFSQKQRVPFILFGRICLMYNIYEGMMGRLVGSMQ